MYQTWSLTSTALNSGREVKEIKAKDWVNLANWVDRVIVSLNANAILFTPTTVMELDNNKYVFVINNARMENGHVVFYVSSNKITIPSNANKVIKKLTKIPTGKFHNARFDIDSTPDNNCTTWLKPNEGLLNSVLGSGCIDKICNNGVNACINLMKTKYPNVPSNVINTFCTSAPNVDESNAYDVFQNFGSAVSSAGY